MKKCLEVKRERLWAGQKLTDGLLAHTRAEAHRRSLALTEVLAKLSNN